MDVSSLVAQLKDLSASIEEIEGRDETYWRATFPMPHGADYAFVAYVYSDGGAGISANLHESDNEEWFWHIEFEEQDYSSAHELQKGFLETMILLLDNPTRIVQVKKLLNMYFFCAYLSDGEWLSPGGNSALRISNFTFPEVEGKVKEYRSAPVRG